MNFIYEGCILFIIYRTPVKIRMKRVANRHGAVDIVITSRGDATAFLFVISRVSHRFEFRRG